MSYLGRRGATAPLNSADIPDDVVQGTDIAYLENDSTTQNLGGTYSTERMYLNDSYTLNDDVTVTGHLALGSIADSDVVITQDSTERTITGSGTIESGELLSSKQTDLTGMTGTIGSSVVFPTGHMIGFGSFSETSGSNITTTGTRELELETAITMVVKSASSKMLIQFQTSTAEGDGNRGYFHIRRSINGATATTLGGFGTSDKGHAMTDVDGQFVTIVLNDIDTHGQAVGTTIKYYVRMIAVSSTTVYWRTAGSNASGYVMEIAG